MKDRILKFLAFEKISPAEFADKIGVQRSSMSHILNGRNQPSAAFIQKMLQVYPLLNSRWLMIGEGSLRMNSPDIGTIEDKPASIPIIATTNESVDISGFQNKNEKAADPGSLFLPEQEPDFQKIGDKASVASLHMDNDKNTIIQDESVTAAPSENTVIEEKRVFKASSLPVNIVSEKEIEQVLFFYKDKTFTIYRPS